LVHANRAEVKARLALTPGAEVRVFNPEMGKILIHIIFQGRQLVGHVDVG
jgi:nitrate reductase NapAB chaperone NapD